MSVKEYVLKFTQLSHYALDLMANIRARMRKFGFGLLDDLILESKEVMLNNDIDLSRLVVYMQLVEDEKKRQAEVGELKIRGLGLQMKI